MTLQTGQQARKPPVVLTIAGYDPSNGAGITADLQVFAAHGLFGISAITALTVQSTLGVEAVEPVTPELLQQTLRYLTADIQPVGIKIGMLGSAGAVRVVADLLKDQARAAGQGPKLPVVLDPVLRSSSGTALLDDEGVDVLLEELLPNVNWITPNQAEAEVIGARVIGHTCSPYESAATLTQIHPHLQIVVTGGDTDGAPTDFWRSPDGSWKEFVGTRIATTSTHGTGCAFSSALLSRLVLGAQPVNAIAGAKAYVEEALRQAPGIGQGRGPMGLLWPLRQHPTNE